MKSNEGLYPTYLFNKDPLYANLNLKSFPKTIVYVGLGSLNELCSPYQSSFFHIIQTSNKHYICGYFDKEERISDAFRCDEHFLLSTMEIIQKHDANDIVNKAKQYTSPYTHHAYTTNIALECNYNALCFYFADDTGMAKSESEFYQRTVKLLVDLKKLFFLSPRLPIVDPEIEVQKNKYFSIKNLLNFLLRK